MRTGGLKPPAGRETSRFPCKEPLRMPGSSTTPGRPGARVGAPVRLAFRHLYGVGAQKHLSFAAQWLACAIPCRRFATGLADSNARLGADADRYSFIAADFHRLLLAGLPAHSDSKRPNPGIRGAAQ